MFTLPTKTEDMIASLNRMRDMAAQAAIPRRVQWLYNHYWMQGYRHIHTNYAEGLVDAFLPNDLSEEDPRPSLKVEELVYKYQAEMGRLLRMDTRPTALRRGFGLDSIRKASAARVELEYLTSSVNHDALKASILHHCLMFGMCGIGTWAKADRSGLQPSENESFRVQSPSTESRLVMEPIPCWELYPIPYNPTTYDDVFGYLRKRWMTTEWVKSRGIRLPNDKGKLNIRKAPYGQRPESSSTLGQLDLSSGVSAFNAKSQPETVNAQTETEYVQVEEYFFLHEEKDRLARWVVKIGDWIAVDKTYEGRSVYCPIGICRYYPLGFYGRSFVELLIPLNREQEALAHILCQNVKEIDAWGTIFIPNSWGVPKEEILEHKRRNKVINYEPDPMSPDLKVQTVTPLNLNDFPGKVLAMLGSMLDRMTQQNDLMRGQAPGRVDSASALSFLNDMSSIPLSVPANCIAEGYAQAYREVLASAPELLKNRNNLPLIGLDDNLIGLEVNGNDGTVKLNASNFPAPFEVEVGIKDKLPTPPTVREQKLMGMLQSQIISPTEFRFYVWRENLDLPVGAWAEQENYRKSILQVLSLFGDGQKPGQTIGNTLADNAEIHLMVIDAFMAKTEFQFASVEVRKAFENLKMLYQQAIGQRYPEALPQPEDAALMQQQMMKSGGMPQLGGPPM